MPLLFSKLAFFGAALVACAPPVSIGVGLANAPAAPHASVIDSRPNDVIANGPDSCDRGPSGGSPLRGSSPCARVEHASGDARAFAPRARTHAPLLAPHSPCWVAADPWPVRATPASLSSCEHPCSPTLVACSEQ